MQDNEKELMMKDTFGHISLKQLASYDQNSLSWKMSEGISRSDSRKFLATLPKMGMMQNGVLFELVMLAHHIKEQDCSLLPTPLANDAKISYVSRNQVSLSKVLLPTPTSMHVRNHDEPIEKYQQRIEDYNQGKTLGKPGASTGLAVRWKEKQYRMHWIKVN
jgi:hypothetical protein